MRFGSLFSGIEAVSVAWKGMAEAAYLSEIAPFPCDILKHHYPHVPNYGDVLAPDFIQKLQHTPVDVLVGGSPCQAFSQAGEKQGTNDPRGQLTPRFFHIATTLRVPTILWENVVGVLSNPVFPTILHDLGESGYRWAYRVLDAQYFGVPQHRRRVFLVANYEGTHPGHILFEEPPGEDSVGSQQRQRQLAPKNAQLAQEHGRAVTFRGRNGRTRIELGDDKAYCLRVSRGYADAHVLDHGRIRKLTPEEYEAVQGFPEGYTNIRPNVSNRQRYQVIGNSMAVPVIRWLGKRIFGLDSSSFTD